MMVIGTIPEGKDLPMADGELPKRKWSKWQAVVAMVLAVGTGVGGAATWAISTVQDDARDQYRLEDLGRQVEKLNGDVEEIKDRSARTEAMVEILLIQQGMSPPPPTSMSRGEAVP